MHRCGKFWCCDRGHRYSEDLGSCCDGDECSAVVGSVIRKGENHTIIMNPGKSGKQIQKRCGLFWCFDEDPGISEEEQVFSMSISQMARIFLGLGFLDLVCSCLCLLFFETFRNVWFKRFQMLLYVPCLAGLIILLVSFPVDSVIPFLSNHSVELEYSGSYFSFAFVLIVVAQTDPYAIFRQILLL